MQEVAGFDEPEIEFAIHFTNAPSARDVTVSLGTASAYDGLTQMATEAAITAEQNGGPPGILGTVNIGADGVIEGIASNGRKFPLAQLAIAAFSNKQGLTSRGSNYYETSLNSGSPQIGEGLTGGRGAVRASQLETSNVDLAQEFTRLIIAQRGFSANARTIAITAEVLEELNSLIR
jgi:flagellar hook protein FlgE